MYKQAFSVMEIKSTSEKSGKRIFTGTASTPTPDRVDDVVEPKGAVFKLPLPFLWQHERADPVGWVTKAVVTSKGIDIEGEIADIPEKGKLKDRLDEAWQMIKNKLVRGLSIGFNTLESAEIQGTRWGEHIIKWLWLELSAVTIPCNEECNIVTVKAAYNKSKSKTALGHKFYPSALGLNERLGVMKTLQEQLLELKETRATKVARMKELTDLIKAKSATNEDNIEFDALMTEIDQLASDIRLKSMECISANTANPVVPKKKTAPAVHTNKDVEEKFKGQNFTRKIIAKAVAGLDGISPISVALKRWGKTNPNLVNIIKADVEGGGTDTGEWGAELVNIDNQYTGDFIEYLKEKSIFDQLPLREVPHNILIKGQDGAATANWVGESNAIPVSAQDYSNVELTSLKIAALAVVSNELLRDSSPSAELLVRDALVAASTQKVDTTFFSTAAAVPGVSPAGMLNGVSGQSASGTGADELRADIKTLINFFITAKNASGLHFAMNPALALSIQMLYNALGQPEFPDINQEGGTLLKLPVHTGDNVASDDLIILKPSDIYKIGDLGVTVSVSREASIEMSDAPAQDSQTPTAATGKVVSMYQTESTAIKVVRPINFAKRRAGVVQYVDDAAYDNSSS